MIYWKLFYEFFKMGLFAVGGGLATLPFLEDISVRTGWFTTEDITNMIAISQSTPGPIGVNMAAYTGYLTAGTMGSLLATMGLIMPSLLIIMLIAGILERFRESKLVKAIFYGLKPASLGLIFSAWLSVVKISYWQSGEKNGEMVFFWQGLILAGILLLLSGKWKVHPILLILLSAIAGILLQV